MATVFASPPPAAVSRILATFDRAAIEGFIAVAIDLLDLSDPDPEAENVGLEDDFAPHPGDGPGCTLADGTGDTAWIEWTSRDRHQRRRPAELLAVDASGTILHEDAEDDDPAGQADEDGLNTELWRLTSDRGAGCSVSDPDAEHDGREPENFDEARL